MLGFPGKVMRCNKCGTESTTGKKFCAACGSPLSSRCPKCGAENAPSSAYREDCGTALAGYAASAAASSPRATSTAPNIRVTPEQSAGDPLAYVRMDKTWLGSVDIAINKAWTARAFDTTTDDLAKLTQSGQQGFGRNTTNNSRVVIFGGGIPVKIQWCRDWSHWGQRWQRRRGNCLTDSVCVDA